jgi:basic membrane lipoprotein Med (substrate-binding protein (PBP1-ABC) superfamily)
VAAVLIVLVAVVASTAAIAVLATRADGAAAPSAAEMRRIALVVPRVPLGSDDSSVAPYVAALEHARSADGVQTRTFAIDPSRPGLPQDVRRRIGSFGLVLLAAGFANNRFAHVIARHPHTRFVVMDAPDNHALALGAAVSRDANATDVFFATGPTAYLAGYLSASMGQRTDPGKHQAVVSIIVSDPALNANEFEGFIAGVAGAGRGTVSLISNQTHDASDPAVCERIANDQIEKGSTTVYADAGPCSAGALAAAAERGVWAIASDPSARGPEILGSTVKRLGRAADSVITSYLEGALPRGHFDIGIERNDIAFVDINRGVPARIRAKLARVKQENIDVWKTYATPQK